ncbi:IS66 family insertion sequence element accessory protein TnpB [sulfur-oxidizing endosymbiont of Gigantopelta aegis]|uniref:IS66 family insertion sequence element accessory protein TnpB n=1 Tax=sulfur-oxidizing endosymbiont of Gigantopelta aegis TaxID=2794934 RepID=UPI0018DB67AE|nr:IS66 family insertion sequence element accessory protein TnpB [sulfur-oxidizing endosymbiont of Gigantopelta aegis]
MITGITVNQVYLVSGVTDMRKATNGLSLIVSEQLEHNPFDGSVFVFVIVSEINLKYCTGSVMVSGFTIVHLKREIPVADGKRTTHSFVNTERITVVTGWFILHTTPCSP